MPKKMSKAFIILPNQLFKLLPINITRQIIIVEALHFFSDYNFHKKKLLFHRASLKYYQSYLEKKKHKVIYLDCQTLLQHAGLGAWLQKIGINQLYLYDPIDTNLEAQLKKEFDQAGIQYELLNCPLFLCQESYLKDFFSKKDHYSMNSFYISQRKQLNVLLENGKPQGGKWSFDKDNRQKLGKNIKFPKITGPKSNIFTREAKDYVDQNFPDNPGTTENFIYPVTHPDTDKWFNDFLEHRFDSFGPYEDAISSKEVFLFHSLLSPLLNSGLITAHEVLDGILYYCQQNTIRLNSLEGFVRQLIGWREFMRAVYIGQGHKQKTSNFWKFKHTMPRCFYNGTTGIEPVDTVIHRVIDHAYTHHIERLMVLGNFMLLCEIHPKEVYRWFMELFIDAYEWVMVPNTFGMSQYADGGMITTKPYISSSNYIRKMSDFKAGPWCDIWDSLYWRFIHKHKKVFAQNPRMKLMAVQVDRMQKGKIVGYIDKAEKFLKHIHNTDS